MAEGCAVLRNIQYPRKLEDCVGSFAPDPVGWSAGVQALHKARLRQTPEDKWNSNEGCEKHPLRNPESIKQNRTG